MKQTLAVALALALAAAALMAVERLGYEQRNNTVEIVADLQGFMQFVQADFPLEEILAELSRLGIESVGLREWALAEKMAFGYAQPDLLLYKQEDWPQLLAEPAGLNPWEVDMVAAAGMRPVPFLAPNRLLPLSVGEKLLHLEPHLVILTGDVVVGFPDRLDQAREALAGIDATLGLPEFLAQQGTGSVASAERAVRVHGITAKEMAVLAKDRVISRYIRAVRERNIRVLYLRPFPGADGWARTVGLIGELIAELEANGYQLGTAAPYDKWRPSRLHLWIIGLGILAGAGLLCQYWFAFPARVLAALLLIGAAAGGILAAVRPLLMQQAFALIAAVVFPVLAVAGVRKSRGTGWNYLFCTLWSGAGTLLIIGILSGTPFLIKLAEFRGVKLMHIAPVGLVFAMGLLEGQLPIRSRRQLGDVLQGLYRASVPVKYLLLLALAAVVGAVYVLRTANFILPIPQLEIALREGLERVLVVRPRFKEILIGHPALVALAASKKRHPLLMSLAVIGQLSLINTFTHTHTPLFISALRTVYGLIIGYIIGILVWNVYQKLRRRAADDPRFRLLRLP